MLTGLMVEHSLAGSCARQAQDTRWGWRGGTRTSLLADSLSTEWQQCAPQPEHTRWGRVGEMPTGLLAVCLLERRREEKGGLEKESPSLLLSCCAARRLFDARPGRGVVELSADTGRCRVFHVLLLCNCPPTHSAAVLTVLLPRCEAARKKKKEGRAEAQGADSSSSCC